MAYADETAVERAAGGREKLIQLTDLDGAIGDVDAANLADAIAEAESWIDSYIQPRHAVPVENPPELLRRLAAAETVYVLKGRREALTDLDQERHEERNRYLEDVRAGKVSLGVDPPPPKSTSVAPAVTRRESQFRGIG